MNNLRDIISNLFQTPMGDMSYVRYLTYVNEAGKVSARTLLDLSMIILTFLEEQEKKQKQNEANFNDIQEILGKLVGDKMTDEQPGEVEATPTVFKKIESQVGNTLITTDLDPPQSVDPTFACDQCDVTAKSRAGLKAHQRSHNPKE